MHNIHSVKKTFFIEKKDVKEFGSDFFEPSNELEMHQKSKIMGWNIHMLPKDWVEEWAEAYTIFDKMASDLINYKTIWLLGDDNSKNSTKFGKFMRAAGAATAAVVGGATTGQFAHADSFQQ